MHEKIICAGFGGQGIMILGKLLTYAGMNKGFNVTWMPSYGAEVRGGTAHSMVIISDSHIAFPRVINPTIAIVMNRPSFTKFEKKIVSNGILFVNSSLVKMDSKRDDIEIIKVPATEMASSLGNDRVANMVVAGSLISKKRLFTLQEVLDCLKEVIPERGHDLIPVNEKAITLGYKFQVASSKFESSNMENKSWK